VNDELDRMCKEVTMALFEVVFCLIPGGTKENH
jgi:hypothetical protein